MRVVVSALLLFAVTSCSGRGPNGLQDMSASFSRDVILTLETADSFEILALHPEHRNLEGADASAEYFGDYRVLGKASLGARKEQHAVLDIVYEGILDSNGDVAGCFNPRHGIRAQKGAKTVELIICYECLSMKVIESGAQVRSVLTAESAGAALTKLYESHGLSIAK